jgi:SAM-dependent methyltransferase
LRHRRLFAPGGRPWNPGLRARRIRGAPGGGAQAGAEANLRAGDIESLPYGDDQVDVVTGFNSLFFAADMVAALREARRVARPGTPVLVQVWGPPERNDLEPMKEIARGFLSAPPADAPAPPELWRAGVLETMAKAAGLTPQSAFDLSYAFEYENEEALADELRAPMGLGALAGEREGEVRSQIIDALASHRRPDGGYRLDNQFHFLIAAA